MTTISNLLLGFAFGQFLLGKTDSAILFTMISLFITQINLTILEAKRSK